MKKIDRVLLIDDDFVTNMVHEVILKGMKLCEKIQVANDGGEGLECVRSIDASESNLILLDVNMPGMDGFDFLEAYSKLNSDQKGKNVIFMLTTSQLDSDRRRAESYVDVKGFLNKPLTEDSLNSIVKDFF